jgi:hypothetical protein
MSDIEHRVMVVGAVEASGDALQIQLEHAERQGWELAAAVPGPDGQVSLVFKRPRPLLGSAAE